MLEAFLLMFARAMGMIAILPLSGGMFAVPNRMVVGLAMCVGSFASWNGLSCSLSAAELLAEFLLGFLLSLPFTLFVDCAQMLGQLFDTGRGQNIAQMYDPSAQFPETTSAVLGRHFVWTSLVVSGGLISLYLVFSRSVVTFGVGRSLELLMSSHWGEALLALSQFWRFGLVAAVPILLVFLLVDAALSFFARVLPQIMLHSEVFMVKSLLGTICLLAMMDSRLQPVIDLVVQGDLLPYFWLRFEESGGGR